MPALRRWIRALTFVATVVALEAAPAQAPAHRPQSSPDSVRLAADLFFRAVADERWQAAASMMDTTFMRFIVAQRLRWQQQVTRPDLTIDDFLRDDPAKPRVVAEYELKRYRNRSLSVDGDVLSYEFAGIRSLLELARLTSLEATIRYIQAQDVRLQQREAARRAGCPDSVTRVPASLRHIVGVTLVSDTVAYLLHEDGTPKEETDGLPRFEPMVMQLRLRGRSWIIIPGSALLRPPVAIAFPMQCGGVRRPTP